MTETPNRTDKDKTKKESTKIVLSLRDNIIDAVVDSLDEEDSQTPRAPCPSPQSSGPKSTLQLGNLIISSSSGLGGSSLNNGMPHSEAVPLNGSAALLHPFISTPDEKKKKKTKKEPTEQDTSTETPNIGNSTMHQEEENEGVSKENESRPAKENVSEEMTTKEEQNEKGSEGEKEEEAEEEENRTKKSMNTAWETRIADYFVVVGTRAETVAADIKSETVKESYTAVVLDRVPAADYKDTRLPGGLDIFCFPNGVNGTASQKNTVPISSMFTLTAEDGTRLYVTTLRIYENVIPRDGTEEESGKKLGKDKENDGIREWYMPVCLCVISHRPFFSLYKSFLSSVHTKICELDEGKPSDFEGFITNFMFKTPVPIPGVLSLDCGKEKKLKLPYPEDFPFIDVQTHISQKNTTYLKR